MKKETYWRIAGEFKNRWWKRPICWIKSHEKRVINPFGLRAKQCSRCGKYYWRRNTNEPMPKYTGEVGVLYGVRFITKKR